MLKQFEVLKEYNNQDVENFNKRIETFLEDKSVADDLREAVSFFYLTLNEKEEMGCLPSTHAYECAERVFRHSTGKILTSIEMIGLSENQEKATKDVIKNIIRDGLYEVQKELSEGKWGQSVEI